MAWVWTASRTRSNRANRSTKTSLKLPPEELKKVPNVAGSLSEALDCLQKDHAFLLKGNVFTEDFIDMWISTKRKEHDAIRLRPHPYEFFMYYDV